MNKFDRPSSEKSPSFKRKAFISTTKVSDQPNLKGQVPETTTRTFFREANHLVSWEEDRTSCPKSAISRRSRSRNQILRYRKSWNQNSNLWAQTSHQFKTEGSVTRTQGTIQLTLTCISGKQRWGPLTTSRPYSQSSFNNQIITRIPSTTAEWNRRTLCKLDSDIWDKQ